MARTHTPQSPSSNGTHPALVKHRELVALYAAADGQPGKRASLARGIAECELDLTLDDVQGWEPWVKPTPYTTRYAATEDEVREQVTKLRDLLSRDGVRESVRATADKRLAKLIEQAQRRQIAL